MWITECFLSGMVNLWGRLHLSVLLMHYLHAFIWSTFASCWAWSRLWLHCSASASWRDILMDISCQGEGEHCLRARQEIETSGDMAKAWSTLLVPPVDPASWNAGPSERCWRIELAVRIRRAIFVLHFFQVVWIGGAGPCDCFFFLWIIMCTCWLHS